MANIREVEMLNNAISNVGESALRRRQLQQQHEIEMQRLALEQQMAQAANTRAQADEDFRQAQMRHYNNIEDMQMQRVQGNQSNEGAKALVAMIGGVEKGVKDGSLKPDVAFKVLNGLVTKLPQNMQQDPQIAPYVQAYSGNENPFQTPSQGKGGLTDIMNTADDYRKQAAQTEDPAEKTRLLQKADVLDASAKKQSQFAPVKPPYSKQEQIQYNESGSPTNRVTTYLPPDITDLSKPAAQPPVQSDSGGSAPSLFGGNPVDNSSFDFSKLSDAGQGSQTGMIRVLHPDGVTTGMIPAANLQTALQQGYKQIQ